MFYLVRMFAYLAKLKGPAVAVVYILGNVVAPLKRLRWHYLDSRMPLRSSKLCF